MKYKVYIELEIKPMSSEELDELVADALHKKLGYDAIRDIESEPKNKIEFKLGE